MQAAIAGAEARLTGQGRLLIRKSGTEPLIRVMAECEDEALLLEVVDGIVEAVKRRSDAPVRSAGPGACDRAS